MRETSQRRRGARDHEHICRDVRADDMEAFRLLARGPDVHRSAGAAPPLPLRRLHRQVQAARAGTSCAARSRRTSPRTATGTSIRTSTGRSRSGRRRGSRRFPDGFRFAGTQTHRYRQIGNAVPVLLGEAVGRGGAPGARAARAALGPDAQDERFRELLIDWHRGSDAWCAAVATTARDPWHVLAGELLLDARAAAGRRAHLRAAASSSPRRPAALLAHDDAGRRARSSIGLSERARGARRGSRDDLVELLRRRGPGRRDGASRLLPGVGDYVCQAVLTFGFGRRQVLVDRTTARVAAASRGQRRRTPLPAAAGSAPSRRARRARRRRSTARCSTSGATICRAGGPAVRQLSRCRRAAPPAGRAAAAAASRCRGAASATDRSRHERASSSTVLPSAGRLMRRLRDIGYDLPSAVADLVDNSIDANARHVDVDRVADGPDSWIRVADDGIGMTAATARRGDALRQRTRDYERDALGHFGLGLKTASLSQCRRLTVASRSSGASRIAIRRWDLDEVLEPRLVGSGASRSARRAARGCSSRFRTRARDRRAVGEARPGAAARPTDRPDRARTRRPRRRRSRDHLAMVFHRFLGGEAYDGRPSAGSDAQRRPSRAMGSVRARRAAHAGAAAPGAVVRRPDDAASRSRSCRTCCRPSSCSVPGGPPARRGPEPLEPSPGLLHLPPRPAHPGRRMEPAANARRAREARADRGRPAARAASSGSAVDVAKMRVSIPEELRPGLRAIASARSRSRRSATATTRA